MFHTRYLILFPTFALTVFGCLGSESVDTQCDNSLPGDVDCADFGGSDGKADKWDGRNDPHRLSQSFNYRIDELPKQGEIAGEIWAASYWPTHEGSTNRRWQGEDILSPTEKYDAAFNGWAPASDWEYATSVPEDCGENAKEQYGAYVSSLGPAAAWQAKSQGRTAMFDGIDNDDDDEIDECSFSDKDGIETWWGLCHAWAPAAILEPEPLHAVELGGQRFEVADIKGLIMTVYDGTESMFLGGRCNAKEFDREENERIEQDECRDVNAGAWHVVITNFIGVNGQSFVEDRTANFEVWNQPMQGYEITAQEDVEFERVKELLKFEGDEYPYNDEAVRFVEVKMTTDYLTEGDQSTEALGSEDYIRNDRYHYILEINEAGKITGGEWVGTSQERHPDFLWVPLRPLTGWQSRSNPNVDLATVRNLIELSRKDEQAGDPEPTESHTFSSDEEVAIPDNDPSGAQSSLEVAEAFDLADVSVTVDIEHTWIGDLRVEIEHNGTRVVLQDQEGGSADDLSKTFAVPDFRDQSSEGVWTLHVSDHAGADTGSINSFSVTLSQL